MYYSHHLRSEGLDRGGDVRRLGGSAGVICFQMKGLLLHHTTNVANYIKRLLYSISISGKPKALVARTIQRTRIYGVDIAISLELGRFSDCSLLK